MAGTGTPRSGVGGALGSTGSVKVLCPVIVFTSKDLCLTCSTYFKIAYIYISLFITIYRILYVHILDAYLEAIYVYMSHM